MAGHMPLRSGVHQPLEDAADAYLREDLRRHTRHSENDIMTPWKTQDRKRKEVYVVSGTPDPATRRGMYGRAANSARPELNSRDGYARPRRVIGATADFEEDRGWSR